jgi:hypothetical protein
MDGMWPKLVLTTHEREWRDPVSGLSPEAVFVTFSGAQESITPAYVAWRAGTTTLFLLGF